MKKIASRIVFLLGTAALLVAQSETVVVRPVEIHDVFVNPGMGITTFQRFNGQAINPGLKWSEVGPEEPFPQAGQVDFPPTSVAYLRWFWSQIEPEAGQYRWDIIDQALQEARRHEQKLAFRIMPYDQTHPLPDWYRNSGARRANSDSDPDGKIWSPDSDDPLYFSHWGKLTTESGRRYNGHPDLDTVDVSTVGYWGEGWGPYLPSWETQQALIDLFLEAFPDTHLLMNFDEPRALKYGTQRGAGWRLDCWGDMGGLRRNFAHMLDMYPQQVVRAGIQEIWKDSPVSLETCWTPGHWFEQGFDLDYILEQGLRWHASTVNIKSSAIPESWKPKFDEFQKQIGYRFILRKLEYPASVSGGEMMAVSMWWFNAGIAPVYDPYPLAIQLYSPNASAVLIAPPDIRQWLPGDALFEGRLFIPYGLPAGRYRFRVALLDEQTRQPAIRLAIQGRQDDGWYDLGEIQVR